MVIFAYLFYYFPFLMKSQYLENLIVCDLIQGLKSFDSNVINLSDSAVKKIFQQKIAAVCNKMNVQTFILEQ